MQLKISLLPASIEIQRLSMLTADCTDAVQILKTNWLATSDIVGYRHHNKWNIIGAFIEKFLQQFHIHVAYKQTFFIIKPDYEVKQFLTSLIP